MAAVLPEGVVADAGRADEQVHVAQDFGGAITGNEARTEIG